MNNEFNIHEYFTMNYNLGRKPIVPKFSVKPIGILFIIISLVVGIALTASEVAGGIVIGILAAAVFALVYIGIPYMAVMKVKKKADEWQRNFDIRSSTWDAEFDKFHEARLAKLNPKKTAILRQGLDLMGLDPDVVNEDDRTEEETKAFPQKPFAIAAKGYKSYYRRCADGNNRTDENKLTWIFFGTQEIFIYTVEYKLTVEDEKKETMQELFYSDIVSIKIETSVETPDKDKNTGDDIGTIAVESFSLVVPGNSLQFAFTSNAQVDSSIQGMKGMIRLRKNGPTAVIQEQEA